MAILYKNIRNGKVISIPDKEYQKTLLGFEEFENDFFRSFPDLIEKFKGKRVTDGTIMYTVKYRNVGQEVHILYGPLKNSGQSSPNKRIQVSRKTPVGNGAPYFAVGSYNTIDKRLYFVILQGIRGYIRRAQAGTSYSSLWVNYKSVYETYINNEYTWEDKIGRSAFGCSREKLRDLHCAIINYASFAYPSSEVKEDTIVNEYSLIDFTKEISKYGDSDELPRNPRFRDLALNRENFTCELCGTHKTFTDRNDEQYFEGHHLIMYNPKVQRRYKYCLDHPDNIVCLCPNCHKRIHNSSKQDTGEMLVDLFSKHKDLRSEFEVENLAIVLNDYLNN